MEAAQVYWDSAADSYEEVFSGTLIGKTRRDAVWRELQRLFGAGKRVLEINCGTGLDAVFLAEQGVELLACDISPRMVELARRHAADRGVGDRVEFVALANENLGALGDRSLFDGAFSNFSGLNCLAYSAYSATGIFASFMIHSPMCLTFTSLYVPAGTE